MSSSTLIAKLLTGGTITTNAALGLFPLSIVLFAATSLASKACHTRATFVFETQQHLCLKKCCPCALVKDRFFCVSKIVGEIKHVKSGKLFFKHKIQRTNHFVCISHVLRAIKHDHNNMASEMESTVEWTNEKEDELVELWQERPCLYLISSTEYADRVKKSIAVREVADELRLTGL